MKFETSLQESESVQNKLTVLSVQLSYKNIYCQLMIQTLFWKWSPLLESQISSDNNIYKLIK